MGASQGGITPEEMPDVGDRCGGMETANYHGMYVPMQQSCRMQDVHMYPRAQRIIIKKSMFVILNFLILFLYLDVKILIYLFLAS